MKLSHWTEPVAPGGRGAARTRLRRSWLERLLIAFGAITSIALLASAAGLYRGLNHYRSITFLRVPTVEAAPPGEPVNWLLVGSDSREGIDPNDPNAGIFLGEPVSGKRTDTIMVARVDPANRTVDLVSVPRDLWVTIAETGQKERINAAFNGEGGEQRLVATVEQVLGIDINHYAEVNFVGFQSIIESLGGVPVYFDAPVRDPGSGLDIPEAGCQILDGFQALAFVRGRKLEYYEDGRWKNDPTSDLGRSARQQYLITRIADLTASKLDLTNIGTIDEILTIGGRNLVIDDGASARNLFSLARTFAGVGGEGIRRYALPVTDHVTGGGAQVLLLQEEEAQATLDVFRGRPPVDPTLPPSQETVARNSFAVDVANGARIARLAATTAEELTTAGFVVASIGDAPEAVDRTVIYYPASQAAGAAVLGTSLASPPLYFQDDTLTQVQLVVGPDYTGLAGAGSTADTTTTTTAPPVTEAPAPDQAKPLGGWVPGPGPAGTPCAA